MCYRMTRCTNEIKWRIVMDVKVCPSAVDMIVSFEIIVGGKFKISIYQDSIKDL